MYAYPYAYTYVSRDLVTAGQNRGKNVLVRQGLRQGPHNGYSYYVKTIRADPTLERDFWARALEKLKLK